MGTRAFEKWAADPFGVKHRAEGRRSKRRATRDKLVQGLSEAEMSEALESIFGAERAGRASIARLMTAGGASFDPVAFARPMAALRGGTQRAIGGLHARSAQMARAGLQQWLALKQRQEEQRAASRQAAFGGLASLAGAFGGWGGGAAGGAAPQMPSYMFGDPAGQFKF